MLSDLENPSSIFSSQMIESSILSSERNACMAVSSYLLQHVELNAGICVMTHSLLLFAETRHLMDQSTACLWMVTSSYQSLMYAVTSMKGDCFLQSMPVTKDCIQKLWNCWVLSIQQTPPFRQPWYICLLVNYHLYEVKYYGYQRHTRNCWWCEKCRTVDCAEINVVTYHLVADTFFYVYTDLPVARNVVVAECRHIVYCSTS